MPNQSPLRPWTLIALCAFCLGGLTSLQAEQPVFNVRDYGATGVRQENARAAIQKAIEACSHAGGGTVDVPAGDYTTGGILLRSHVRVLLEPGATVWVTKDTNEYANTVTRNGTALFFGVDLEDVTVEGRGTIDGQAEYDWKTVDIKSLMGHPSDLRDGALLTQAAGKPLLRTYPRQNNPRLIVLIRCKNVRIAGISFLHAPSYNIMPYACEHMVIDGVYILDSLTEGVWADGIDPDGCKDLHISNSTIETGDDAIVFYSDAAWGPALPCENITVTNCRLSSASAALKFCDGNIVAIRNVTVTNCVITNSNRGIAFMDFNSGYVSDVVISNITIECNRKAWFWWGDGDPILFELRHNHSTDGVQGQDGAMRNILLQNIIARGPGTCRITGLPNSLLQNVTLDNVKLFVTAQPDSPLESTKDAMTVDWVKDFTLRNFRVIWDTPASSKWATALRMDHVQNVDLDNVQLRQASASPQSPALILDHANGAVIRNSLAEQGTGTFAELRSPESQKIEFFADDLRAAQVPYRTSEGGRMSQVKLYYTLAKLPGK